MAGEYALGQRWLSTAEQELGLGTLVSIENRRLTLLFPACDEQRVYAQQSAPLMRVRFAKGDIINHHQGWSLIIERVSEEHGLLTYHGVREDNNLTTHFKETLLDHHFQFDQADQRFFNGQLDDPKWFDLRRQCIEFQYQHATSALLGFVGARVDLIPHQLHIAAQVGQRHAPRVLLADEVGLGKTIEAALIIHQQLLTQRAKRVLIVLPPSLVHQWLVEMLRRVNLSFAIIDKERCEATGSDEGNPFETEQLVIAALDFLTQDPQAAQQAQEADWDLLVVDEAHHLQWSPNAPSPEYLVVERLAQQTKGVLLLTATPDQLGHESHFARLRLLDPARFHHYADFVKEEQEYSQLAKAVAPLLDNQPLDKQQLATLQAFSSDIQPQQLEDKAGKSALLKQLLDRHGTGRLLFRNARSGIQGFPSRKLFSYPLELPDAYQQQVQTDLLPLLRPELNQQENWTEFDPRVNWLIELLKQYKATKVLTICASAATAISLAEALRVKSGLRAAVFHEGMSIVERDKAANYFAQNEDGARVLICSEIGSEGRNFQFAHHLVLFDLPLVPDLLEQRIGRLDRIGQQRDVHIHVPYFIHSAQQVLFDWYHHSLNAFEQTCPAGTSVYEHMQESLQRCLLDPRDQAQIEHMLEQSQQLHWQLKSKLEAGRDRLLEINSSGGEHVQTLLDSIQDADQSPTLERFMGPLFDALGVMQEDKDESCYLLKPTESMLNPLPGLSEDGMPITYERTTAIQLEDVHFFSWDHPVIQQAMEMVTGDTLGKAAIALCHEKSLPAGTYWLETLYVLSSQAPQALQLSRFLPPTPIRLMLDAQAQNAEQAFFSLTPVNQQTAAQLTKALQDKIHALLTRALQQAQQIAAERQTQALATMQQTLSAEEQRLVALQQVNPSIRDEEIHFLQRQQQQLGEAIDQASLSLEAMRLVVNNP